MKTERDYGARLQQGIGSLEAKALVDELRKKYSHAVPTVQELRRTLDGELRNKTLKEMLYALREE